MLTLPRKSSLALALLVLLCGCPNEPGSSDTTRSVGTAARDSSVVGRIDSSALVGPDTVPLSYDTAAKLDSGPPYPRTGSSFPRTGGAQTVDRGGESRPQPSAAIPGPRHTRARTSARGDDEPEPSVEVPVYFATSRARTGAAPPNGVFGGDRDRRALNYGVVSISIPPGHRPGELERPGTILWVFHRSENPAKHVVISRLDTLSSTEWLRRVQQKVGATPAKEVLVYVHGYNVPFDDAMRRAGQLGYDLGYENGTITAFSWPSKGSAADYAADVASAEWTAPSLEQFLARLADSSGAERISVIAHSMGNRALASVLRSFASRTQPAFHELVLAAPDVDADVFEEQIVPILGKSARHSTLYVSSGDQALGLSTRLHAQLRAGVGGARMFGLTELDVVDASKVPAGAIDHSYYAENKEVIDDIFMLVRRGLPPEQRNLKRYPQYTHAWRLP